MPSVVPAFVLQLSKGLSQVVVPLEDRRLCLQLACFATLPTTGGWIAAAVLGCAAH